MTIPDINLLVFAYNQTAPHHRNAKAWLEQTLNSGQPVGIPWVVSAGFIRLMTHPRVLVSPMSVADAVAAVRAWLAVPSVIPIHPGDRFPSLFFGFLEEIGVAGNLTTDAQIAAIAVEHNAVLCSNDRDFQRFSGLRVRNPIG